MVITKMELCWYIVDSIRLILKHTVELTPMIEVVEQELDRDYLV